MTISAQPRRLSAAQSVRDSLAAIRASDPGLNCFTSVFGAQALADAAAVDSASAQGRAGTLAGRPFAVKNLFDVTGEVTVAGSLILRGSAPAAQDATVVARLRDAGAILVGGTNMDEFAYGFTTENVHDGPTHNPHDRARSAGGSSGGSAAAVAAGLVPLALGTDTNGSIRVPASLCGIYGLKPTLGRLSRAGVYPFVEALDHVGAFARSVRGLADAYDVMQGPDAADPSCTRRVPEPAGPGLDAGIAGLRAGVLGGWFADGAGAAAMQAVARVADALGARPAIVLRGVAEARAAAFCLTAASGAALHLDRLRCRAADFDPATRTRLLAGAMLPHVVIARAERLRLWFRDQMREVFRNYDILIAPATPCIAPLLGQLMLALGDRQVPLRPNLGIYTQPISFIGLPVVTVPLKTRAGADLPIGVQIIAPAWHEATALRVAAWLEQQGVTGFPMPRA